MSKYTEIFFFLIKNDYYGELGAKKAVYHLPILEWKISIYFPSVAHACQHISTIRAKSLFEENTFYINIKHNIFRYCKNFINCRETLFEILISSYYNIASITYFYFILKLTQIQRITEAYTESGFEIGNINIWAKYNLSDLNLLINLVSFIFFTHLNCLI